MSNAEVLHLADTMLSMAQTLRIQQVQLINASDWQQSYKDHANEAWSILNEAHKRLTMALESDEPTFLEAADAQSR